MFISFDVHDSEKIFFPSCMQQMQLKLWRELWAQSSIFFIAMLLNFIEICERVFCVCASMGGDWETR